MRKIDKKYEMADIQRFDAIMLQYHDHKTVQMRGIDFDFEI